MESGIVAQVFLAQTVSGTSAAALLKAGFKFVIHLRLGKSPIYSEASIPTVKAHVDYIKQKSTLEHVQNVQIQFIQHMCKISSQPLLSIHIFCSI